MEKWAIDTVEHLGLVHKACESGCAWLGWQCMTGGIGTFQSENRNFVGTGLHCFVYANPWSSVKTITVLRHG